MPEHDPMKDHKAADGSDEGRRQSGTAKRCHEKDDPDETNMIFRLHISLYHECRETAKERIG